MNESFLDKKLNERKANDALRSLKIVDGMIDFCSNDYLGIVRNKKIVQDHALAASGSTGSRLLAGNYALIEQAETMLAAFHQSEAALIFNSGYDANIGVLSAVPQRGDTILYDTLSHASIRDGIRLSFAQSFSFDHNNLNDLEHKLKAADGNIFVVTESVFSMDGDTCPLHGIIMLCKKYNASLILDEAHATGVIGAKGEGLAQQLQLHTEIFCRVYTFGKAVGCHGAVVAGSKKLQQYLVNFARSFIYSTALPPVAVDAIIQGYNVFPSMQDERAHLQEIIHLFQQTAIRFEKLISNTPIQVVMVPGNAAAKAIAQTLQQHKFDVRAILYPTVPKEKERLRIVLHAFNAVEETGALLSLLQ
jgi:8-amino-7-oxononanoate synthase